MKIEWADNWIVFSRKGNTFCGAMVNDLMLSWYRHSRNFQGKAKRASTFILTCLKMAKIEYKRTK